MSKAQRSSKRLTRRLATAIVGWRVFRGDAKTRRADVERLLEDVAGDGGLQFQSIAAAAQKAAARLVAFRLAVLVAIVAALLILTTGSAVKYGLPLLAKEKPIQEAITPTPGTKSTAASWTLSGHVYEQGTKNGLPDAAISLDVLSDDVWQVAVVSVISGPDGSFSVTYELPSGSEAEMECRLRVEPPSGWNHIVRAEGVDWTWSREAPNVLEGTLGGDMVIRPVVFEVAIRRTFTGTVYFEGEGAPQSVTVGLHYQEGPGAWSDPIDTEPLERPPDSPIAAVPFVLEHISGLQDVPYQISIATPAQDWAACIPPEAGDIEGSAVVLTPGRETDVGGIAFAGPLPIRLGYALAEMDPPFSMENPGIWADDGVYNPEIPYPYATRPADAQDTPSGASIRWPLWLPPGNDYAVWVGLPADKNSAIVTYDLVSGADGVLVESTSSTEITQCQNVGEPEMQAGTYPAGSIGRGGQFWLEIDETKALRNYECISERVASPWYFRMPVWWVEIRRARRR